MLQFEHGVVGDVLRRLGAGHDLAGVFGGEEALGNAVEHQRGQYEGGQRAGQGQPAMLERQIQRAAIAGQHRVETALQRGGQPAAPGLVSNRIGAEKARGQQGDQGQRHRRRHQHRQRHHHGEFVEQQANHALHEEDGDEDGHQRQRNRHDGEGDFTRAPQRRLHRRQALFDVTDDVFQHHDGVVHHQAHRQRDAQQRDIVQAVAQPIHQPYGADQRDRQR